MILHYLVIWLIKGDMRTRKETPMDLKIDNRDLDDAELRYDSILSAISKEFKVSVEDINIINVCRL